MVTCILQFAHGLGVPSDSDAAHMLCRGAFFAGSYHRRSARVRLRFHLGARSHLRRARGAVAEPLAEESRRREVLRLASSSSSSGSSGGSRSASSGSSSLSST